MTAADISLDEYARQLAEGRFAEQPFRFRRAVNGFDPGEALTAKDRRQLIRLLVRHWRWSDRQIAQHTKWTDYTVARLREELLLAPNPHPTTITG